MNALKAIREERGLTQKDVARAMNITRSAVEKWERGIHKPSREHLERLADFFDCSIEMLGFSVKPRVFSTIQERNVSVEEHLYLIDNAISRNWPLVVSLRMNREDLYQELVIRLIQAIGTYNPEKASLKHHIWISLDWGIKKYAAIENAHGVKGTPRDCRLVFSSIEAMAEVGIQLAAAI